MADDGEMTYDDLATILSALGFEFRARYSSVYGLGSDRHIIVTHSASSQATWVSVYHPSATEEFAVSDDMFFTDIESALREVSRLFSDEEVTVL